MTVRNGKSFGHIIKTVRHTNRNAHMTDIKMMGNVPNGTSKKVPVVRHLAALFPTPKPMRSAICWLILAVH